MADVKSAYQRLIAEVKQIALLGSCAGVLGWDERTYMPKGGAAHRAEQLALLVGMMHERATAPQIGEWLAEIDAGAYEPHSEAAVNVREIRRGYERAVKLPRSLVEELARVTTMAQQVWRDARTKSEYALFQPHLQTVLDLKRREAAALGTGATAYDALLDDYEPGETTENLTRVFSALRDELVELVGAIAESEKKSDEAILRREYPIGQQEAIGKLAAAQIGFDFDRGRLDITTHPFCSGIGPGDTRLTTRYNPRFFSEAFFSTLHEAGHGIYDQGLSEARYGTPMGESVSLGIHESQSRMWENFVGRSRGFWTYFFPTVQDAFPTALTGVSEGDFYAAVNAVTPSFIRVEADEATYNLHIMLRFEIEQALIDSGLKAEDVPGVWNETFEKYLGLTPPNDALGCLQDVHWSGGGIGYFPTYALGNLYAAQFFEQAREDVGDLNAQFAEGNFEPLKHWLTDKIYSQGQRYRAGDLVEVVTGKPLSHEPLMRHLRAKYEPLYEI